MLVKSLLSCHGVSLWCGWRRRSQISLVPVNLLKKQPETD